MITYLPLSSSFIRLAGRFVDEAFGVAAGYNFFVSQVAQIPFEIVACNIIITYWSNAIPVGAIVAIVLVLYMYVASQLASHLMNDLEFSDDGGTTDFSMCSLSNGTANPSSGSH